MDLQLLQLVTVCFEKKTIWKNHWIIYWTYGHKNYTNGGKGINCNYFHEIQTAYQSLSKQSDIKTLGSG
jgi:hypothetical protein